jgi:hypothetical protein
MPKSQNVKKSKCQKIKMSKSQNLKMAKNNLTNITPKKRNNRIYLIFN